MLANEGDWCHEDLAIDLPPWLVAVARAAGLRWQGLTFSYLVLQPALAPSSATVAAADRTPAASEAAPADAATGPRRLRVISGPIVSKGKIEAYLCGDFGPAHGGGGQVRAVRLDRDRGAESAAWDDIARGDVLAIDPAPAPAASGGSPRLGKEARVTRIDVGEPRR